MQRFSGSVGRLLTALATPKRATLWNVSYGRRRFSSLRRIKRTQRYGVDPAKLAKLVRTNPSSPSDREKLVGRRGLLMGLGSLALVVASPTLTKAATPFPTWPVPVTGATGTRAMPDRLAVIFDVKDFGALGNSDINATTGQDDTTFIQAAVNAASAVGGGTIYFPRSIGAYKLTAPIVFLNNNCVYNFVGDGSSNVQNGLGGSQIVGNFAGYLFDRNQVNSSAAQVYISYLGFKNGSLASGSAIRLLGVESSRISCCTIQAGQFGVNLGGVGAPASATFTGNSSGTTLTVSGITGTIDSGTFPCPITGTGVPGGTSIVALGTGTGGNGTYITNQATTCSGSTDCATHPNAPTAFSSVVESCVINGLGTYNVNPASSFVGVGVQLSPETTVRDCHIDAWGIAVQAYGLRVSVYGCQMESNTYGVVFGRDAGFHGFAASNGRIADCSFEGCVSSVWLLVANGCTLDTIGITGEVDGSHNSTHGVLVDGCQGLVMNNVQCGGAFNVNPFYLGGGAGQVRRITAANCNGGLSKDGSINYSCITAVQCPGFPVLSATLAQLNTAAGAGDINVGERRLQSDCNTALLSQVYNAAPTTGGSTLASVWWDGSAFRYG